MGSTHPKSKCQKNYVFFWRLQSRICSLPFQFLEVTCILWLVAPSFIFEISNQTLLSNSNTPASLSPLIRIPVWLSWAHLNNLLIQKPLITSAKSPLLDKETWQQVLGIWMWTSLKDLFYRNVGMLSVSIAFFPFTIFRGSDGKEDYFSPTWVRKLRLRNAHDLPNPILF